MEEKKLFLLDAFALIYRAYYALISSPRFSSKGINTSAIFGFCNTLDEVLRKENPDFIGVCFDPPGGKTFRNDIFPEYKAQRQKQPEDITISIPIIKNILGAYRIPVIEMEGYEADDVIGSLAVRAQADGFTTYMMTLDKDYGQLVTDKILMYRPALKGQGFEIRGPIQICERYGIQRPEQIIDLLALEGDASDNIPGCPGIGEKTARKLIAEFGSIDNMIAHVADLKGATQRKIAENQEQILFSRKLVTIKTDIDVPVGYDELRRCEPDVDALVKIFSELDFKTFVTRLGTHKTTTPPPSQQRQPQMGSLFDAPLPSSTNPANDSLPSPNPDIDAFDIVATPVDADRAIKRILQSKNVGVSLYSVGETPMTAEFLGIAIAPENGRPVYITLPATPSARQELLVMAEPLFSAQDITIVSHDIKRDKLLLRRESINFTARYFDTSIAHYLIKPETSHNFDFVAYDILGYKTLSYHLSDLERRHAAATKNPDAPRICCEAATITLRMMPTLRANIESSGLASLLDEIELPLVSVLAEMEWEGVRIDVRALAEMSVALTARMDALAEEAYTLAGERFNISSPTQVGEILFGKLALDPKAKRTKRGAYSTTEDILEKQRHKHPIVGIILQVRALRKLLATYIDALPLLINPLTGKIHTSFNQTVTATGRISSTNPNLQNIPIRTDDGREIRRAFIPDPGNIIMSADYSQIELRLVADLSDDPHMVEAFRAGEDIHRATAARIYHIPLAEVTESQRRNAKTANFGIIYGISAFGLSERLDIPRAEAKLLIDGYLASYPRVAEYMDESIARARADGYVTTIKGRKRYLPDIHSRNATVRGYAERNAINAPIQGSAADIIKIAMIHIDAEIRRLGLRSRMIIQVHDELVFNVIPDELPAMRQLVIREMENAWRHRVPLEVSCGSGHNWLEAH